MARGDEQILRILQIGKVKREELGRGCDVRRKNDLADYCAAEEVRSRQRSSRCGTFHQGTWSHDRIDPVRLALRKTRIDVPHDRSTATSRHPHGGLRLHKRGLVVCRIRSEQRNIGGRVDHLNGTRRQLHRGERENRSSLVQKLAEQVAEVRVVSGMLERLLLRPINLAMKEVSVADRAIGAEQIRGVTALPEELALVTDETLRNLLQTNTLHVDTDVTGGAVDNRVGSDDEVFVVAVLRVVAAHQTVVRVQREERVLPSALAQNLERVLP